MKKREGFDILNPDFYQIMQELHRTFEEQGFCQVCHSGPATKRMEELLAAKKLEEVQKVCEKEHEPLLGRITDYKQTTARALKEARDHKASAEQSAKECDAAERRAKLAELRLRQYEKALLRIIVTVGKSKEPVESSLAELVEADKVLKALSAEADGD